MSVGVMGVAGVVAPRLSGQAVSAVEYKGNDYESAKSSLPDGVTKERYDEVQEERRKNFFGK